VVGIVIDDDLIGSPIPVTGVSKVKRGYAEVEAAKPKAAGAPSLNAPLVAAAEAAGEAAMLEGMVYVIASIVSSGVVSHPLAVVVDVRRFGVARLVAIGPRCIFLSGRGFLSRCGLLSRRCCLACASMRRWWTVRRNVATTYGVTALLMVIVLCEGGKGKEQRYSEN
jgi:hypothetical protein